MNAEQWQQVQEIFRAAIQRNGGARAAFLDQECAGDPLLRAEVEALLSSDEHAGAFLERLVYQTAAELFLEDPVVTRVGQSFGHYQILAKAGEGGMGKVYLAEDTTLGRKVALKVLSSEWVADRDSHTRFLREARLAAALEHPNICTIYEAGETNGECFISMQYVEGETLKTLVGGRPLDLQGMLSISMQVADALRTAHRRGIVHRDIKSTNIMITPQGAAKVLDFGIAKLLEPTGLNAESELTASGSMLGTPSYTSPEQARGCQADRRSDIFSFGVVLYEMATGRAPFRKPSAAETMNAIINEPHTPVRNINHDVPVEFARVIDRALAKDASDRYQAMEELMVDLQYVIGQSGGSSFTVVDRMITPYAELSRKKSRGRNLSAWRKFAFMATSVALLGLIILGARRLNDFGQKIDSLAVLPFVHESAAPDLDYLADGLTESLTSSLSQLNQLRVMARSTVFRYKGRNVDPQTVGRDLGVRAVLTGTVVQREDNFIIQVELVYVADGSRLWGEQYKRKLTELAASPADLSLNVLDSLRVKLTGEQKARLSKQYTKNSDAYQRYIRGRYFLNKRTADGYTKAIDYFQQTIEADPTYALAYSGLADSYASLRSYGLLSVEESLPKARAAAEKALELDNAAAEVYASLALVKTLSRDWLGAETAYKHALALNPNYETAHHWYAMHLVKVGRLDEGMVEIKRAQELDPLSLIINTEVGRLLYFARRYDDAVAQLQKTLEMDKNYAVTHMYLAGVYEEKQMFAEAISEYEKAVALGGPSASTTGRIGRAYALTGRKKEASKTLEQFNERAKHGFVPYYTMAMLHMGLGDNNQAFAWLEKGLSAGAGGWFLQLDPVWDGLRSDARFQHLLSLENAP